MVPVGDMSFTVRFIHEDPQKKVLDGQIDAEAGESLVQVAYRKGILIPQTCGGTPSCTDCRVRVLEGLSTGLEPALGPESRLMGNVSHITLERLSCQAVLKGPCVVEIPALQLKRTSRGKEQKHGKKEIINQSKKSQKKS